MSETGTSLGPYQVLRRLGGGGMGEVFLAWDPRLEREVAVKRIRAEIGADPERRARLRQEARITAGLNHPAIVQVFDLITEGDADHLVMEYVPGPTLHQLLAKGRLPLGEGVAVATDVAEGLAYAHRHGVLHRDLKTENVLIAPEGQAKIADFGIALRSSPEGGEERLTREGMVVGTHRVMSPEQACGDEVDARSDLFSLGVLFYEIFTGTSPFLASTARETLQKLLNESPAPVSEHDPEVPPELSDLIAKLLEKEPLLRPGSAREVADALRELAAGLTAEAQQTLLPTTLAGGMPAARSRSSTRPATVRPALGPSGSAMEPVSWGRRLTLGLGVAAALALAAVAAFRLLSVPQPAKPTSTAAAPLYVAVLQPAVSSGPASPETELLAFAIRGALQSALTRLDGVFSKAASEVDTVTGPPEAVARAVAADEVLEPSFACQARTCSVQVSRLRGSDGAMTWSDQIDVPLDSPLTAARALAVLVRRGFHERAPRPGIPDLLVSPEDYASYLDVRRQLVSGSADNPSLLKRLAEIRRHSPDFVDPYLLEAQVEMNRFEQTRDATQLEPALALLADAQSRAPGDPEVRYTLTYAQLRAGRLAEAEKSLADFELQAPGDVRVLDLKADLLERQGRPAEALALSRTAIAGRPSWARLYGYARRAWRQGEIAAARESLETLLKRAPGNASGRTLLATIELTNGDPARAAALYEEIVAARPDDSTALGNLGLARMLQGDYDSSATALERAVAAEPGSYPLLLNLAQARWLQGRKPEAAVMLRRVLALSERDPATEESQRLTIRAQAFAQLGEPRRAVAEAQDALRLAPRSGQVAFEASLVSAMVGDRTAALVNAERARDLGFDSPGWFRLPWFDSLRSDPDFQEILRPRAAAAPP